MLARVIILLMQISHLALVDSYELCSLYSLYYNSIFLSAGLDSELAFALGKQLQLTVDEEQSVKVLVGLWDTGIVDFSKALDGRCLSRKPIHMESLSVR